MKIHTVREGETPESIAALYDVDKAILCDTNGIGDEMPAVGEELLILKPTRTFRLRAGEGVEGLTYRFGVKESEVRAANPRLSDTMAVGGVVSLRQEARPYGMAATNGYFYKGCRLSALKAALPSLTYVTFACAYVSDEGIKEIFSPEKEKRLAEDAGVIPIVKIFERRAQPDFSEKAIASGFADEIVRFAKARKYFGVALELPSSIEAERINGFLVELRKRMIGSDLILITEWDGEPPYSSVDYSDGCVLGWNVDPERNTERVKSSLSDFATASEGAKTFVELPSFGLLGEDFFEIRELTETIRRSRGKFEYSDESGLLKFKDKKGKEGFVPSLKYIKAILDSVSEYGFMGIAFDVGRIPLPFLLLYNALFKTIKSFGAHSSGGI